jgi:hypothetical protein
MAKGSEKIKIDFDILSPYHQRNLPASLKIGDEIGDAHA